MAVLLLVEKDELKGAAISMPLFLVIPEACEGNL
jgi:hypothetical protein